MSIIKIQLGIFLLLNSPYIVTLPQIFVYYENENSIPYFGMYSFFCLVTTALTNGDKRMSQSPANPRSVIIRLKILLKTNKDTSGLVPQVEFTNTTESAIITTEAQKIQPAYVMTQS